MSRKTAKELETSRELAYILYLNGEMNKEIAGRVGVSEQTISKWVGDGSWKEKRAAKTITRPEIINKTLERISDMLNGTDGKLGPADADKLVKLAALIERLDKKNSPVLAIEIFMSYTKYLQNMMLYDREITSDFIKKVNKYQDAFITSMMNE